MLKYDFIDQYDEKMFLAWLESPHNYHYNFTPKGKILGFIPRSEWYSSPWNYFLGQLVSTEETI